MIRILHIVGTMNRGGAETLLMELYHNIDRTKIQFDFLVYNYSGKPGAYDEEILSLGGKIHSAKKRFYKGPIAFLRELKQFFKEHPEYKIVHAHQYAMSGYMLAAAKKEVNAVTIAHSHVAFHSADFVHKLPETVGKHLLSKYADFYFGCSQDALEDLSKSLSDDKRYFVVNNAVDIDKFAFSKEKREFWRSELCIDNSTTVLGYVARFLPVKNHEFLIKTFAEFARINPNSVLALAGEGALRPYIESLARELGVYDKVKFLGVRSDIHDIINAFDVFVMPSRYEGLGIVLIEAQANGLPCVISADVIPAEADTGAGLVTRVSLNESPKAWAEACLNAPERKPSEEVRPAIIKSGYDINAVAEWLRDFYIKHWN